MGSGGGGIEMEKCSSADDAAWILMLHHLPVNLTIPSGEYDPSSRYSAVMSGETKLQTIEPTSKSLSRQPEH
ncbi:MAG: hypothetical protein M3Q76_02620, partial [Acidobacteriota bacterium]|nr:hypothetical protein [Acidobacteriota bacterium]